MKRIDARVDLDELIRDQQAADRRPRPTPREVLAGWQNNAGAGIGAAVLVGIVGYVVVLPDWPLVAVGAGGVVWGALMLAHGAADEALAVPKLVKLRRFRDDLVRDTRAQVAQAERERDLAFREIVDLENTVQRLTFERDTANLEIGRLREAVRSRKEPAYVAAVSVTPQKVRDATDILQAKFNNGVYISRRRGNERGWSDDRYRDAQALLIESGVLQIDGTQPVFHAKSLDEATQILNSYCIRKGILAPPVENVRQVEDAE